MKKILLIATGGTIASLPTENGLAPSVMASELIACVPQIAGLCELSTVQPFNKDSTNIAWSEWLEVAAIIRRNYADFDGFVVDGIPLTVKLSDGGEFFHI